MTIRKGEPWGEAVRSPADLHLAATDADARDWVVRHRERDVDVPPFGVTGGDLARTIGGGAPGRFPGTVTRAPIDLLRLEAAGRTTWAVAHVVARHRWWQGELRFVMNAQFFGRFDVAPKAHPNDGLADVLVVDAAVSVRARWQARGRARTGSHLPHPGLQASRTATVAWTLPEGTTLWVDGVRWMNAPAEGCLVMVVVEPDGAIVHG